ncbi:hypothetical protein QJU23_05490 [Pasteurella atlantica]|uniref:Uncharacterized protein n=2 Tax=Pasteurellaceae TaxID=712 RepID=A0ACC6HLY3_9PAST|nr:hypothetical protein [Pasteurella atlantica]MDP8051869.1 hypothetical protein [Pasteurella atlantica]MDP8105459.1 hypothetical protein [Pasteurella atlantica]MDP8148792.1 hypothetical protein [Pasteurella atlantica]
MSDMWQNIQALRVAPSWLIEYNVFFDYEPISENMEWFYASCLLSASSQRDKKCFELVYEPEGGPDGQFVIYFFSFDGKNYANTTLLDIKKTKSKKKVTTLIEEFMWGTKKLNTTNNAYFK